MSKFVSLVINSEEFILPASTKVSCAAFHEFDKSLIVSGDNNNTVCLWKLTSEKPLARLNQSNSNASNQVDISAVTFTMNDAEVISGSSRGMISVWDVNEQKVSQTLKGHTTAVTCLNYFKLDEFRNTIISGSYDTTIKLWDLRSRNCMNTFKGHTMQINCIDVSPDCRWISSGSQDGLVKLWDTNGMRSFQTFVLHDSPVTCIKYNPIELTLASGSNDRSVKYWDLENFTLVSSTKTDATPIQKIIFTEDGKYLFSAAHESLKLWNMEKEGQLIDSIEGGWRGIMDLSFNTDENALFGLTSTPVYFGLWAVPLNSINFSDDENYQKSAKPFAFNEFQGNENKYPPPPKNEMIGKIERNDKDQVRIKAIDEMKKKNLDAMKNYRRAQSEKDSNPRIEMDFFGIFDKSNENEIQHEGKIDYQNSNSIAMPIFKYPDCLKYEYPQPDLPKLDNRSISLGENSKDIPEKLDKYYSSNQTKVNKDILQSMEIYQSQEFNGKNNFILEPKIKEQDKDHTDRSELFDTSLIGISQNRAADIQFSALADKDSYEKSLHFDAISEVSKEHGKILGILQNRANYLRPINHWWNSGNFQGVFNAISQHNDPPLVQDCLQKARILIRNGNITIDHAIFFLQKNKILIESKFQPHVKFALTFINETLDYFRRDLMSIRASLTLDKVDLAREERLSKYEKLLEEFKDISKMPRIRKCLEKKSKDVTVLAQNFLQNLTSILQKESKF